MRISTYAPTPYHTFKPINIPYTRKSTYTVTPPVTHTYGDILHKRDPFGLESSTFDLILLITWKLCRHNIDIENIIHKRDLTIIPITIMMT